MNKVDVSIIVPIFNAAKYIGNCVNSILKQTFMNYELILVDDGSKDDTLDICTSLAGIDSRIKVIHQENAGSSAAKNAGLSIASGEYIKFCDADDTIDEQYIENLYYGVKNHNADVCIGSFRFINMCNEVIVSQRVVEVEKGFFSLDEFMEFYPRYMPQAIIGSPCNKLYRREVLSDNSILFNTKLKNNEDTHFNFEYLSKCKTVYVSDDSYYNYMNRSDVESASKRFIEDLFEVYVLTYLKAQDFLKETNLFDKYIGYQSEYFVGLVIGAINGIINGNNNYSRKEKLSKLKSICNNTILLSALNSVHFKSRKKQMVVFFIKHKYAILLYCLFSFNRK